MRPATIAERAYMAGLLDGEGCITIGRWPGGVRGRRNPSFAAQVVITNTVRILADWPQTIWGGAVVERKLANENHKDNWAWRISGAPAVAMLCECREFMLAKAGQVDILVALQREIDNFDPRTSPETIERRESLHRQLLLMHGGAGRQGRKPLKRAA